MDDHYNTLDERMKVWNFERCGIFSDYVKI
jgi:hypothetical protein